MAGHELSSTKLPPPPHRSALCLVGWNGLLLTVGLAMVAGVGEIWGRYTMPFLRPSVPTEFVPKVGLLLKPNAEIRWTNHLDFWTVSRTNSLGFLDREPLTPELAAASCHITMIGDSFVEARQVPIADKFHVLLEHHDLGLRTRWDRPNRTTSIVRYICAASVPQAGRARFRPQRLSRESLRA